MMNTSLLRPLPLVLTAIFFPSQVLAHHNYTRPNLPDPQRMLALYHFDNEPGAVNTYFTAPGFSTPRPLKVVTPTGGDATLTTSTDVSYPVLGSHSVRFNGRQSLLSDEAFAETVADCTIEIWIKWDPQLTSATLQVGANSGPKLLITRDTTNALNDRFGLLTAHGDFRSAPNFTDWTEWDAEPTTNGWWVMAVAINSTGIETIEDPITGHEDEAYLAASTATFFVNDHPLGDYNVQQQFLGRISIAGMKLHEANNLYVRCSDGAGISIDDFIFWKEDLTQGGTQLQNLFDNGRGTPASTISDWSFY